MDFIIITNLNAEKDSDVKPLPELEVKSNIRQHLLNPGYMYKYEFDKSNDSLNIIAGDAPWLSNELSSLVNFDKNFDYRRIAVYR